METEQGRQGSFAHSKVVYGRGIAKVVIVACCIIVLAVAITGGIGYMTTSNAMVDKLKSRDMVYIVQSMAEKIDGRIARAEETSLLFAEDAEVHQWIAGGERDEELGRKVREKMKSITNIGGYSNTFLASAASENYWETEGQPLLRMSPDNPDDYWFYVAIRSGRKFDLNLDYNKEHTEIYVYMNTLVGDVHKPVGVAGVALSLKDVAKEFSGYKFGEASGFWLVDKEGKIHLADNLQYVGRTAFDFLPSEVVQRILGDNEDSNGKPKVLEYTDSQGELMDLAYQATKTTDWKLVFKIPRSESVAVLDNIKLNAILVSVTTLLVMVFIFYFLSHRVTKPFKQAIRLAEKMEKRVKLRTEELAEKNQNIMDSIDYAKRLQEAVLPTDKDWASLCREYFVLWRPRDVVGGDFYWLRKLDDKRSLIIIGDCTGHGVPGALMTMMVNSILDHLVDHHYESAGNILEELDCRVRETLHRKADNRMNDDGLDIGICYIEEQRLVFAGAKIPLYIKRGDQVHILKGDNRSIGYRRSKIRKEVSCYEWKIEAGDCFYLTTDGYVDQNGGTKDYSLGRNRFIECIESQGATPLREQCDSFEKRIDEYRGSQAQRDDITVIAFTF